MALRGNLKDFSLPDVFQLVTFSRKSGVLRIKRADGAEGSVWFREGDVFFAQSNWHAELLGERLVRSQRVTPQALERALSLRAAEPADGRRLGQILVDEGYITDKVLEAFVSEQIQETIFDLMRWDEGDFDFEATPQIADEDIGLAVSIENIVMEGSRRLEEWTRIRKKIPSMDVVFKMATAPGEGTFEISLKPMEWSLLLLVDGSRSVAELAYATDRTDFEVARIIYGLFSAGLLEFATDEEIEKLRGDRLEREAELARIESERAAAVAEQTAAAQQREAALEAQAESRARAATPAPAETPAQQPAAPAEMPEFLAGGVGPSAEDAAVLQEMMGAVLSPVPAPSVQSAPPVPPAAPVAEEPVPVPEPQPEPEPEPAPEPIPAPPAAVTPVQPAEPLPVEAPFVPESPIPAPPILESAPAAPVFELPTEEETLAQIQASLASLDAQPPATPEAPAAPAVEMPEPATTGGFERDLMALGLGELPEVAVETPVPAPIAPEAPRPLEWVDEPVEPLGVVGSTGVEDFAALAESIGAAGEPAVMSLAPDADETPDFTELLGSLVLDTAPSAPAASAGVVYPSMPEAAFDFDEELLRESEPAQGGGVISTDAFLEDIGGDIDFSGGMTDELSALTGAGRPSRPTASVNKIPEPGAAGDLLHRDTRVDRDTLLKIIDGIKNL